MVRSNVVELIESNKISSFPVPISLIHHMIHSYGYQLHQETGINRSCIIGNQLICPICRSRSDSRIVLSHGLGNIVLRCGFCKSFSFEPQKELESERFALYFTMPPGPFEHDAKYYDYFQLSEKYGVPVEYVKRRVDIITPKVS